MIRTGASYKLQKEAMTDKMMGKQFVLSILGQTFIQVGFQSAFFYLFILNRVDYCSIASKNGQLINSDIDVSFQGSVTID
jgi:hypothetical protein